MTFLGTGESVTVQRADETTSRYGSTTHDWSSPTETVVLGCLFAPQSTIEDRDGRDAVQSDARVYMPTGTDVAAGDRLVVRGDAYDVEGEPSVWADPFGGGIDGIEVRVKRVTG